MGWIKERSQMLWESLGIRRFLVIPILFAVFRGADWGISALQERGMTALTGFSSWEIASFVALILIAYWLLEYALRLKHQLTPRLKVSFNPNGGGIVNTPIKEKVITQGAYTATETIEERHAVYIRGLVITESEKAVTQCATYLVGIRKKDTGTNVFMDTQYVDDLQLSWSLIREQEITIPKGVRRYFDIIGIDEKIGQPRINATWPLTLRDVFKDHTTYQLDLIVRGEGISVPLTIEFTWDGKLENVTGKQVSQ